MNATSILCRAQAVDDASPGAWGEDIEQVLGSQDRANDKDSEEPSTIRRKGCRMHGWASDDEPVAGATLILLLSPLKRVEGYTKRNYKF